MPEQSYLPALRFKALTPVFDAVVRATTREREFKRRLLDQLALPPQGWVLDLGAGTGTLALQIKQRHPGVRVTGLDADPDILAIATRKAAGTAGVDFVEAYSTDMPLADASLDAVVSTLFFHHLDAQAKRGTLAEVARVLKPGGELHVGDFGRPADPLQKALFMQVRAFDGFGPTAENASGALPRLIADAGLADVSRRGAVRTPLGTVELLSARRPA